MKFEIIIQVLLTGCCCAFFKPKSNISKGFNESRNKQLGNKGKHNPRKGIIVICCTFQDSEFYNSHSIV